MSQTNRRAGRPPGPSMITTCASRTARGQRPGALGSGRSEYQRTRRDPPPVRGQLLPWRHDGSELPTLVDGPQQARPGPKSGHSWPGSPFIGGRVKTVRDPGRQTPRLPVGVAVVDLSRRRDDGHLAFAVQGVPKIYDEGAAPTTSPRSYRYPRSSTSQSPKGSKYMVRSPGPG